VIYGAFLPGFPAPAKKDGLGTAYYPYALIAGSENGTGIWPQVIVGSTIDVQDVARAHVLALEAPALQDGRRKRLLISSGEYTWKDLAEHIRKERPHLAHRLPGPEASTPVEQTFAPMDTSLTREVLGLDKYIPWTESVLDNIDSCLIWEKTGQF
jgi:nucleoside-diphosphate-sugar epimerase